MSGQQVAEQVNLPFLHGLGQQGVVGITERFAGNVPGLVPVIEMDIHQEPHQLRNCHRWMGVVKLNDKVIIEKIEIVMGKKMNTDHILQGAGNKEVLLFQAQPFALKHLIIWIEDFSDGFCMYFFFNCTVIITDVKVFKIK